MDVSKWAGPLLSSVSTSYGAPPCCHASGYIRHTRRSIRPHIYIDLVGTLPPRTAVCTFSPVLTGSLDGLRQSPSQMALLTQSPEHWSRHGCHDSEFPLPSPQTEVNLISGGPSLSCWDQAHSHHCIPSHCEWDSGAFPPPAEVSAQGITTPRALDRRAPLGLVGHPHYMACADPVSYVTQLKGAMRALRCTPTQRSSRCPDNSLSSATHVFVRHDAVKKPLQPPYNGPWAGLTSSIRWTSMAARTLSQLIG